VIVEALATATPVVATDVGGVRAAVDDGTAALLVPADDLGALVAAVRRLADDRALARRLAARGLEVTRELTLEREAARVAEFVGEGVVRRRAIRDQRRGIHVGG
jgi:glycosyltransferase involved in cell wall biosynthesis